MFSSSAITVDIRAPSKAQSEMSVIYAILEEAKFDRGVVTGARCAVAVYNGRIVGVVVWKKHNAGTRHHVPAVAVAKPYRGKGVGSKLLRHVEGLGKAVKLHPDPDKAGWYRRAGYATDSQTSTNECTSLVKKR